MYLLEDSFNNSLILREENDFGLKDLKVRPETSRLMKRKYNDLSPSFNHRRLETPRYDEN